MNKLFYSGHDLTHSAGKGPHFTKSWVPILKKVGSHGHSVKGKDFQIAEKEC